MRMRKSEVITCINKTKTYARFGKYTYKECGNCRFLHTYLADYWLNDEVECRCPIEVKYRDKIKYTPATYEKV